MANLPDMTLLPMYEDQDDPNVTDDRIRAYNDAIQRQAARYDVTLVDLAAIDLDPGYVSKSDGFHPNNAGYARIAAAFLGPIKAKFCTAK